MDSTWIYWLPKVEATSVLPRLVADLAAKASDPANETLPVKGYRRWKGLPATDQDAEHLILCVRDERARRVFELSDGELGYASQMDFRSREVAMLQDVRKAERYWANFVFEFVHLGGVIWFLFWPFIWRKSSGRTVVHFGIAPFLLMAPAWLGYCSVVGAGVGPAGGILYCWIMALLQIPNTHWDYAFFRSVPKVLQVINQSPQWDFDDILQIYPDIHCAAGPVYAAVCGVIMAAAAFGYSRLLLALRMAKLRRPGFQILPATTTSNSDAGSAPHDLGRK